MTLMDSNEESQIEPTKRHLGLVALFSMLFLGSGHVYIRQYAKAGAWWFINFTATGIMSGSTFGIRGVIFAGVAIQILSALDALLVARKLSRGQSVGKWEWFPLGLRLGNNVDA